MLLPPLIISNPLYGYRDFTSDGQLVFPFSRLNFAESEKKTYNAVGDMAEKFWCEGEEYGDHYKLTFKWDVKKDFCRFLIFEGKTLLASIPGEGREYMHSISNFGVYRYTGVAIRDGKIVNRGTIFVRTGILGWTKPQSGRTPDGYTIYLEREDIKVALDVGDTESKDLWEILPFRPIDGISIKMSSYLIDPEMESELTSPININWTVKLRVPEV